MLIYLIGYSYSGKTTLGRQLAKQMGYHFFDTDKAIELRYHTTIPLLFNHYGETAFRIIERRILEETGALHDTVVSTGGGLPCNKHNIDYILAHGTAIHLTMSVDDIMHRIEHAQKGRPSLAGMDREEQRQFISTQLADRLPYYNRAPLTLPAAMATVDDLLRLVNGYTA